jgi:hypothetical protein
MGGGGASGRGAPPGQRAADHDDHKPDAADDKKKLHTLPGAYDTVIDRVTNALSLQLVNHGRFPALDVDGAKRAAAMTSDIRYACHPLDRRVTSPKPIGFAWRSP